MAATLETTNYKLPIFAENDTTDWDAYNESMNKIDTEMAANKTAGDANLDSIKDMQESLNNTTALVNGYESRIESLESTATANTNSIASINRTDQSQNARLDAIESELNDLPNVTTDITELQTQVAEIKVKNNSQDTEIGKNATAITVNANQISGLRTDLNSLDDRVETLENSQTMASQKIVYDIPNFNVGTVTQVNTPYIYSVIVYIDNYTGPNSGDIIGVKIIGRYNAQTNITQGTCMIINNSGLKSLNLDNIPTQLTGYLHSETTAETGFICELNNINSIDSIYISYSKTESYGFSTSNNFFSIMFGKSF